MPTTNPVVCTPSVRSMFGFDSTRGDRGRLRRAIIKVKGARRSAQVPLPWSTATASSTSAAGASRTHSIKLLSAAHAAHCGKGPPDVAWHSAPGAATKMLARSADLNATAYSACPSCTTDSGRVTRNGTREVFSGAPLTPPSFNASDVAVTWTWPGACIPVAAAAVMMSSSATRRTARL